jgi:hypothetical protein
VVATKKHKRHKINTASGFELFVPFVLFCG